MSKGFSGIPGGMQGLLKQAQKMQAELEKVQQQNANLFGEGSAGGGMVTAVANGDNKLISIKISKDVAKPDEVEMLQDLVVAAVNQAFAAAQEKVKEAMAKVTGNMNLGGLF